MATMLKIDALPTQATLLLNQTIQPSQPQQSTISTSTQASMGRLFNTTSMAIYSKMPQFGMPEIDL
jgi:hypothetical protein